RIRSSFITTGSPGAATSLRGSSRRCSRPSSERHSSLCAKVRTISDRHGGDVMDDEINADRRRFLGAAAMTVAAAGFGTIGVGASAADQATSNPRTPAAPAGSFGSLKQIDAGVLNIGYAEVGPTTGPPVVLLHGWPYDIHSYVDVAPLLAAAGYRVIVPYLRGYGTTPVLSSDTFRNSQQTAPAA